MIDFTTLRSAQDLGQLDARVQEILQSYGPDNPPSLSDALVNYDQGGDSLIEHLGHKMADSKNLSDDEIFEWKIQCLRDEWGKPLYAGDYVEKRMQRPFKRSDGKVHTTDMLNAAKHDGTYNQKYMMIKRFKVDNKGCISCSFEDAMHFLNNWGVHHRTNRPLTRKAEHSSEPLRHVDDDGVVQMSHAWYWKYKEAPKDVYNKLPKKTKPKPEPITEAKVEGPKTDPTTD